MTDTKVRYEGRNGGKYVCSEKTEQQVHDNHWFAQLKKEEPRWHGTLTIVKITTETVWKEDLAPADNCPDCSAPIEELPSGVKCSKCDWWFCH